MFIIAGLILLIMFYIISAWVIVLKYHIPLFMNDPKDLTFLGKCMRWYVYPVCALM